MTAYATSYIPTTTASATRAADVISIGSVTGLSYPMTLFAEFEASALTGADAYVARVDASANDVAALLLRSSTSKMRGYMRAGGVDQASVEIGGAIVAGVVTRAAARLATDDVNLAVLGAAGTADTSATLPATPTNIVMGSSGSGNYFCGYLRRLAIYPSAYTDAQLQAITT